MPSIVTSRFIKCHDWLKEQGRIRSSRQFALECNYHPQNLNEILKGNRDAPLELIRLSVEKFKLNPQFLYSGEGAMFLDDTQNGDWRILTIVTDNQDQERILHVPVPAQAGYSGEQLDPVFFRDLPAYNLPDRNYQTGTYRSFDVAGDSMEPTLLQGDKVICRFVNPTDWITGIRDHHVYVVVTRNSVLVKRVLNHLTKHRHVELISDNDYYKSLRINISEIREVWHLHAKISQFSHLPPQDPKAKATVDELRQTLQQQAQMINQLSATVNQMVGKA
ncbi:MAG: LexA family transcriptional regulator [Saprospiraceae bacterium]|nr:LexA family transcriptional regulator [Saprospiraceae bacterium]